MEYAIAEYTIVGAFRKGIMMNIVWTESDKVFIRLHPEMTDKELAAYFQQIHRRSITISAVKKFRQRIGAKKKVGRKRK